MNSIHISANAVYINCNNNNINECDYTAAAQAWLPRDGEIPCKRGKLLPIGYNLYSLIAIRRIAT